MVRNLLLWAHVGVAVVAFGPTFVFPVWLALARRAGPPSLPFAVRSVVTVVERVVVPLAIVLPATGVALIAESGIDVRRNEWLIASILLYAAGFTIATALGLPNARRVVALLESDPVPEEVAEVRRRARRQAVYGYTGNALFLAILWLMVAKPGA